MTPRIKKKTEKVDLKSVYRVLGDDRKETIATFRSAGGDLDRWKPQDWTLMAGLLTRIEDRLEMGGQGKNIEARRLDMKTVRRALENAGK